MGRANARGRVAGLVEDVGLESPTGHLRLVSAVALGAQGRVRSGARSHLWEFHRFLLQIPLPDVVAMQTRQPNLEGTGEIPLRRLVKEALRMRPSRIVVGEVCQEECLDLLITMNSGFGAEKDGGRTANRRLPSVVVWTDAP